MLNLTLFLFPFKFKFILFEVVLSACNFHGQFSIAESATEELDGVKSPNMIPLRINKIIFKAIGHIFKPLIQNYFPRPFIS